MMTRQQVNSQLLAYLNNQLMLAGLVDRAENALVTGGFGPEEDVDLLMDIIMYLAGANSQYFPLTWKVSARISCANREPPIKVVTVSAA
jgi:hypothetical protein